jgi:hypothetical protein
MPQLVRAFPLRGSIADLQAFAQALAGPRSGDAQRFYRNYGVERETWHLQHTEHGPWVIAVTELADPVEAAPRYADATEAFHLWFKSQVEMLTGIDPNIAPLGPPTRQVFAWSDRSDATQGQAASTV